jgi:hypothetical protein
MIAVRLSSAAHPEHGRTRVCEQHRRIHLRRSRSASAAERPSPRCAAPLRKRAMPWARRELSPQCRVRLRIYDRLRRRAAQPADADSEGRAVCRARVQTNLLACRTECRGVPWTATCFAAATIILSTLYAKAKELGEVERP